MYAAVDECILEGMGVDTEVQKANTLYVHMGLRVCISTCLRRAPLTAGFPDCHPLQTLRRSSALTPCILPSTHPKQTSFPPTPSSLSWDAGPWTLLSILVLLSCPLSFWPSLPPLLWVFFLLPVTIPISHFIPLPQLCILPWWPHWHTGMLGQSTSKCQPSLASSSCIDDLSDPSSTLTLQRLENS